MAETVPDVEYIGVSKLRLLNKRAVREARRPMVVLGPNTEPLAVIIPYKQYMVMQALCLMSQVGH
jgi:hypothetical protein